MCKYFIASLLLGCSINLVAQKDSVRSLQEVTVYANKFPALSKNIIQTVGLITDKQLIQQQANTADILTASGQVFVQKKSIRWRKPCY